MLQTGRSTPVRALLLQAEHAMRAARPAEALHALRRAACIQPADAAIQHDLGMLCLRAGHLPEAVGAFRAALAANPRSAAACLHLGIALQAEGDEAGALAARCRAGALLDSLGRSDEAAALFRRAAGSAPKTALGRMARARVLLAEGQDAQAERTLRQLLAAEPGHAAASDMLGIVLADRGCLEEARACHERAIAAAPHLAGSYYDLVRCRRLNQADAALVARMRQALETPGLHQEARLKLHLALGKAADDLDDPAGAMAHFDAADTLRSSLGSFDASAWGARVDRLIARFSPALLAGTATIGRSDPTPVLVVGLPRSGTTLVEQILSRHPGVHAAGELPFWTVQGGLWEQTEDDAAFAAVAAADYLRLLRGLAPGAARITDKMPLNLLWAGAIHMALPDATIVHCRRAPIDTALSIHRTYFNQHAALPTGGAALVDTIRACERLAAHWRCVLPADRFVELRYEQLTAEPEPVIRRLLAACGLPWDNACLHPERSDRIVRTPSKWQVRQPITPADPTAWRRYRPWLGPLAALVAE